MRLFNGETISEWFYVREFLCISRKNNKNTNTNDTNNEQRRILFPFSHLANNSSYGLRYWRKEFCDVGYLMLNNVGFHVSLIQLLKNQTFSLVFHKLIGCFLFSVLRSHLMLSLICVLFDALQGIVPLNWMKSSWYPII